MAKRTNRTCYTCGKEYYFCPNCPSETRTEVFYHMFCCERCSKIFKVLTDESFKHVTTKECKEELVKLGVSINENLKECIIKHVEKVFSYEEPVTNTVDPITEVDTSTEAEDVKEPKETEVPKPKLVKKSKKYINSEVD